VTDYVETANTAIEAIERAAERLALASKIEMELEDRRPIIKAEAVARIMERDSIAATPAEKIVETDPEYAAHRNRQAMAVVETIRAKGAFEAAKRRADVAIDMGLALGSVQFTEQKVGEIEYDAEAIVRALQQHAARTVGLNMPVSAVLDL
jgi:hypothetical protein